MDNNIIEQLAQQVKEEYGIEGDIRENLSRVITTLATDIRQNEEQEKRDAQIKNKLQEILDQYYDSEVEIVLKSMVSNKNELDY